MKTVALSLTWTLFLLHQNPDAEAVLLDELPVSFGWFGCLNGELASVALQQNGFQ